MVHTNPGLVAYLDYNALRNAARPLCDVVCWVFVLPISFSRLRTNISCNIVFFLGFVCSAGLPNCVECFTGEGRAEVEERDEDGIARSPGLGCDGDEVYDSGGINDSFPPVVASSNLGKCSTDSFLLIGV